MPGKSKICLGLILVLGLGIDMGLAPVEGASQAAATLDENTASFAGLVSGEMNDWIGWDWRIDRPQLVRLYISKNIQPQHPFQDYLEATTYLAEPESLGLTQFLDLPAAEQAKRRHLARDLRDKVQRFRLVIRQVWEANLEGEAIASHGAWPLPASVGDGVTRAYHHLVEANGLDPSDPFSWYDLAYFAGVIGDRARCQAALDAALEVLASLDEISVSGGDNASFSALYLRIALDYAWLLRDQGFYEESLSWVDRAEKTLAADPERTWEHIQEARLIRGLVLAEKGLVPEARIVASRLRGIKVWVRNKNVLGNERAMLSVGIPADKNAWETRPFDFATNWIWALTHLRNGDCERALEIMGPLKIYKNLDFPASYNYRFWNDFGHIFERCGRKEEARLCYGMAAVYRPYFVYYPMIGARGLARIHGQPGAGTPYFLSYRHFYIAGSLFSYAANCALAFETEREPRRKRMLGEAALRTLSACRRRGIQPASALALRGRVQYFRGNQEQAAADLEQAYSELRDLEREDADVTLLTGILKFDQGNYRGSLPWFKRFVTLRPEQGIGWRALGLAHLFSDQAEGAFLALDRAVAVDSTAAAGWYNRGLLNLKEQRWAEARSDLARAWELWPQNQQIEQLMAVAEEGVARRIEITPSRFELRVSRQDSLRIAQLRAGSALNLAAEIEAGDPGTALGWLDLEGEQAGELLAELEAAYAGQPTRSNLGRLAWCLMRTDQPARARELLLPLWDRGISVEEMCLLLEADRALGDATRAQALAASLAHDPEPVADVRLWALVASICLDRGQERLAVLALDLALQLDPGNSALQAQRARVIGQR